MGLVIVLVGPPLPGRDLLERSLEAAIPPHVRILAGDFPRVTDRRAVAQAITAEGSRSLFVVWSCSLEEAEREVYRHYVAMPERLRDARWEEYLEDAALREPVGREAWPAITASVGEPMAQTVARIVAAIDTERAPSPAPPRVLVVEDDPGQRELLCDALALLGCEVTCARDAEEAIGLARSSRPDLVLTDQRMPGMTGTELAAELRALAPDVHIGVITGHADEALDSLRTLRDVDVVLSKPIGIADLVRAVDELARRRPTTGA